MYPQSEGFQTLLSVSVEPGVQQKAGVHLGNSPRGGKSTLEGGRAYSEQYSILKV